MLKIKFNSSAKVLDEARTLTPSGKLVRDLTAAANVGFYNFLSVVVENRALELQDKLAEVVMSSRNKSLSKEKLDKLKTNEIILNKKLDEINNLIDTGSFKQTSKLDAKYVSLSNMQDVLAGTTIKDFKPNTNISFGAIPVESIADFMFTSPQALTVLKKKISPAYAKQRLLEYFSEKNISYMYLYFTIINVDPRKTQDKKSGEFEDWAGKYDPSRLRINISIPNWYFNNVELQSEEGDIIKYPGKLFNLGTRPGYDTKDFVLDATILAEDFENTIRHELQHMLQHLYSVVLGTKQWIGLAKASSTKSKQYDIYGQSIGSKGTEELPHHLVPIEVATDVQDELSAFIKKFKDDFDKLIKSKKADSPELQKNDEKIPEIIRQLFKKYVGAEVDAPLAKQYGFVPDSYDSKIFNSYKKERRDLYKWAIKKGYDFINNNML